MIFLSMQFISFNKSVALAEDNTSKVSEDKIESREAVGQKYYESDRIVEGLKVALSLGVPILFLVTGLSSKLSKFSNKIGKNYILTLGIFGVLYNFIHIIINFPLRFYGGYVQSHSFGLSHQPILSRIKNYFLDLILGSIVIFFTVTILYIIIRRSLKRWRLYTGIIWIPLTIFMFLVQPVVIDPLFNDFKTIEEHQIQKGLSEIKEKAGIDDCTILMVDKSKETDMINAYMTGIGNSKRIVLLDTALNKLSLRELKFVTAHEIGHYLLGHVKKLTYYGDRSPKDAIDYIKNIGNLIKAKESIKSYVVGFGYGINSPELSEIARAINGKKVKANNKNQINKIYEEIAKAISSTISTEANFYLAVPNGIEVTNLPEGLEYKDGTISGTVKTINYSIEDDGNNGGGNDYYKAQPVNFSISFKGKVTNPSLSQQNYKIIGSSTYLGYVVSENEYKHNFNDVDIRINNKVTLKAPIKTTQALASGVDKDNIKVNDSFNINYTIDPSVGIEKLKNDSLYKRNKEIVLVVDTSGSMAWDINGNKVTGNRVYCTEEEAKKHTKWGRERVWTFWPYYYEWRYYYIGSQDSRLNLAKDAIDIFLNSFQNDSSVNIGLVTYSDKAYIKKSFGDNISSQDVGDAVGGTNTGDGLRKAYYMLKNNNDADKYIVLLTDGAPTSYSVNKNDSYYNYNYVLDNNDNYKALGGYSEDEPEATEYARQIMEKINDDSTTKINTFLVGFTSGADISALNEVVNSSENAHVIQAESSSKIQQVYNEIAEEINLPTVKDIKFQLKLPEGLIAEEIKYTNSQTPVENLSIEEGGKVIVGSLDNISYNLIKRINNIDYYSVDDSILEKLKFTVKVKASKAGDYLLGNDENATSITYTDVDGSSYTSRFTPEMSLKVIDEQAPISIARLGMFTNKPVPGKEADIESYVKSGEANVLSGFTYTLGSILDIGYANEADIGKPLGEDLTLDVSTTGIDFRGNTSIMLYTIVNGKLTLVESWKNVSNGHISISGNKLNMGQKYIITQNFVPYITDPNQTSVDIYNSITINDAVNTINSIKLLTNTELPDLD